MSNFSNIIGRCDGPARRSHICDSFPPICHCKVVHYMDGFKSYNLYLGPATHLQLREQQTANAHRIILIDHVIARPSACGAL